MKINCRFSRIPPPVCVLIFTAAIVLFLKNVSVSLSGYAILPQDTAGVVQQLHMSRSDSPKQKTLIDQAYDAVLNCTNGKHLARLKTPRIPSFRPGDISNTHKEEDPTAREASFRNIFKDKVWQGQQTKENPEGLTGSGRGSTLKASVRVRHTLSKLIPEIKKYLGKDKISMLDIPCGDMTWMRVVVGNRTDVDYTGMDIVPELIASHSKHYQNTPHMNFVHGDIVTRGLDRKYDLIFTRQMTQHLKTADDLRIFKHFSDSGSEFLLATEVPVVKENTEVQVVIDDPKKKQWGGKDLRRYRPQNLELEPFNFPRPLCIALDMDQEHNVLWKLPVYERDENDKQ